MLGFEGPLVVVSPRGLVRFMGALPGQGAWPFPIEYVELDDGFEAGLVYDAPDYTVEARLLDHGIFAVGYRFQEKEGRPGNLDVEQARRLGLADYRDYQRLKSGRAVTAPGGRVVQPDEVVGPAYAPESFAYVTDTRPCENGRRLAAGVGLLYHEATFTAEHAHLAVEKGHATAEGAARVARDAGAQRLLLGHFSARVGNAGTLADEARRIFPNTEAAEELKRYCL
jgi:ribonuclease Z